jgi:hypothetical protein
VFFRVTADGMPVIQGNYLLNRTSLFQNCKALISLSFIESEGSVTGYDPG